ALLALSAAHPEVELVIMSEALGDPLEAFEDDRIDVALCVAPPQRGAFQRSALFEDEMLLAVPCGHRLSKKSFVTGRDLASETLVAADVASTERGSLTKLLLGRAPPRVGRLFGLQVAEGALDLVQAGVGVSLLPGFPVGAGVARGDFAWVGVTGRGI